LPTWHTKETNGRPETTVQTTKYYDSKRTYVQRKSDDTLWYLDWKKNRRPHQLNDYDDAICTVDDVPHTLLKPAVSEEVTTIKYSSKGKDE